MNNNSRIYLIRIRLDYEYDFLNVKGFIYFLILFNDFGVFNFFLYFHSNCNIKLLLVDFYERL